MLEVYDAPTFRVDWSNKPSAIYELSGQLPRRAHGLAWPVRLGSQRRHLLITP